MNAVGVSRQKIRYIRELAAACDQGRLDAQLIARYVLREHQVTYTSRPQAFLRMASDPFINGVLGLQGAHVLYGRRNTLTDPQGQPLAEIVEILPPA